jgi:hypothetical protein
MHGALLAKGATAAIEHRSWLRNCSETSRVLTLRPYPPTGPSAPPDTLARLLNVMNYLMAITRSQYNRLCRLSDRSSGGETWISHWVPIRFYYFFGSQLAGFQERLLEPRVCLYHSEVRGR